MLQSRGMIICSKSLFGMSVYETYMFLFLYATGADRWNILRKYGYSIRSKPTQSHTWLVRGERVSGIAMVSVSGLLDVSVVKGTVDGDKFYDFVQKYLLPQLMPFNGVNPHSIIEYGSPLYVGMVRKKMAANT